MITETRGINEFSGSEYAETDRGGPSTVSLGISITEIEEEDKKTENPGEIDECGGGEKR